MGQESRLPRTGIRLQVHDLWMTGSCLGEPFLEHAELTLTTDKPARTGHWISRTVSRWGRGQRTVRRAVVAATADGRRPGAVPIRQAVASSRGATDHLRMLAGRAIRVPGAQVTAALVHLEWHSR